MRSQECRNSCLDPPEDSVYNRPMSEKSLPKKRVPKRKKMKRIPIEYCETVQDFLLRGGEITKCPPRQAGGEGVTQMIYVEGQSFPVGNQLAEYVPSFVRDEATFASAQREEPDGEDDGSAAGWRSYERESIPVSVRPGWTARMRGQL